jgi:NAD(P)-dependent dehydrogenase (short-subunit alcohol dehydrogenase family)
VRAAVASAIEQAGTLDVVVNNAGISSRGPIESFSMEQVQHLFNTNVFGPLRVNQAVLPHMRARRFGVLIHISSTLGRVLPGAGGLYPASNWAREGLAESQRYELKPFNVELAILEPGSFPTPAVGAGLPAANTDVVAEYTAVATPRRGDPYGPNPPNPQEVADAVLALIKIPHGERPLRTVVGPVFTQGVDEYNATYERMRDNLRAVLDRLWD